jgi:Flp pilus assembly pilin Flp
MLERWARRFRRAGDGRSKGQGLAEYALILGLVAIVAIVALSFLGHGISGALSTIGTTL